MYNAHDTGEMLSAAERLERGHVVTGMKVTRTSPRKAASGYYHLCKLQLGPGSGYRPRTLLGRDANSWAICLAETHLNQGRRQSANLIRLRNETATKSEWGKLAWADSLILQRFRIGSE